MTEKRKYHPLEERVRQYIREQGLLPEQNPSVLAAVSGGADSVALLRIFASCREDWGLQLFAVHVEHGIRGEESLEDQRFVEALCRDLRVPLKVFHVDAVGYGKSTGKSVEEAARELRYEKFYLCRDGLPEGTEIAVAHHMDDNAETLLLQLIRGTGWRGLEGLKPSSDGVIRPLLGVRRDEIEAYLRDIGQPFHTDRTNLDTSIPRNKIRREVMPLLRSINSRAVEHIAGTEEIMRDCGDTMEREIQQLEKAAEFHPEGKNRISRTNHCQEKSNSINFWEIRMAEQAAIPPLRREAVRKLSSDFLRREVLLYWIRNYMKGSGHDMGRTHIEKACEMISTDGNREWKLPHGYLLQSTSELLFLRKPGERFTFRPGRDGPLLEPGEELKIPALQPGDRISVNGGGGTFRVELEQRAPGPVDEGKYRASLYTNWLDYAMIGSNLRIRSRRPGDRICVSSDGSHRKIKDYFIDRKIPSEVRDRMPLLADGSEIRLVIGGRQGRESFIRPETELVMKISWRKTEP